MTQSTTESGALALQSLAELARQNALLTSYRSHRKAGHTHLAGERITDMELEALVSQQRLFRMLDGLLPELIAEGSHR